jgi:drug/metabolite transporter (DMT)-like permease
MTQISHRAGVLMLFASAVGWSTSGLFTRAIHVDTPTTILWRGLFGAAGLVTLILILHGPAGLRDFTRLGRAGLGYALASGVGMLSFIGALKHTSVAHVSIIYATVPFAAAAMGWLFLQEKPSRAAMIASSFALTGAVIMVGLGRDGQVLGDILAVIMVLASAAMMGIARANPEMPTLAAGTLSAVWAPLACLPFATTGDLTPTNISLLAAFGLINTTIALALFIRGSRHLPAVETALISALETPMTPLWVWLMFAETPTHATLAGGCVVLTAVLWYIWHDSRNTA